MNRLYPLSSLTSNRLPGSFSWRGISECCQPVAIPALFFASRHVLPSLSSPITPVQTTAIVLLVYFDYQPSMYGFLAASTAHALPIMNQVPSPCHYHTGLLPSATRLLLLAGAMTGQLESCPKAVTRPRSLTQSYVSYHTDRTDTRAQRSKLSSSYHRLHCNCIVYVRQSKAQTEGQDQRTRQNDGSGQGAKSRDRKEIPVK